MNRSEEWKTEFRSFMESSDKPVPQKLSESIKANIHQLLYPSVARVFLSLLGVHLFAGSLTLLVCPQFGLGPIGGWLDLMQVFMPLGAVACAIFCGTLYLGSTALATHLVFSPEMLRTLENTRYRQFALLAALSIGAFMLVSLPRAFSLPDMSYSFFWFLGGALLSQWIFHAVFRLRGLQPFQYRAANR